MTHAQMIGMLSAILVTLGLIDYFYNHPPKRTQIPSKAIEPVFRTVAPTPPISSIQIARKPTDFERIQQMVKPQTQEAMNQIVNAKTELEKTSANLEKFKAALDAVGYAVEAKAIGVVVSDLDKADVILTAKIGTYSDIISQNKL